MKILVTGAAGFIGYHLCEQLMLLDHQVVGLDNLNDYYDVNLKKARLKQLGINISKEYPFNKVIESSKHCSKFKFIKLNVEDKEYLPNLFLNENFEVVCNLAAQAGVRYSLENPFTYIDSNIAGFLNILEACRNFNVKKLIYASSSSVYGLNKKIPFSIKDNVNNPISLYAATKKSNELMAHTYSYLFGIKTIGLRFFTVYGPWGRPDMAMFLFTDAILNDKPIKVFNNGKLSRDFTFIDDIIEGLIKTLFVDNKKDKELYKLYNIGNGKPVQLLDFITEIEKYTGKKAIKEFLPMQAGDVEKTWANTKGLAHDYGYNSTTEIKIGVRKFIDWYKIYYKKN